MQCQCEDSGQRSLGENTVSGVKATRAAHRSKDSRQRSHGSDSQAGSRCSYQLRTQHDDKQSADPVVNRVTADEVTSLDLVISSDMTVELQTLSTQVGYMLVVSLSDQAQDKVRNSPECNGAVSSQLHFALVGQSLEIMRSSSEEMAAEEWRKLV